MSRTWVQHVPQGLLPTTTVAGRSKKRTAVPTLAPAKGKYSTRIYLCFLQYGFYVDGGQKAFETPETVRVEGAVRVDNPHT